MFMGTEKLPPDNPVRFPILAGMMNSGTWNRDVRIDFAAEVPCEAVMDSIETVLLAGASNGKGQLGLNITGNGGRDFLLEISEDYGCTLEYATVADEWGTAMIQMNGGRPRTVEFELRFEDGGWFGEGLHLEVEDLREMLRHRRRQGEEAVVSIFTEWYALAADLLPLLLACQAENVRVKLVSGPDAREELRKRRFGAPPVSQVIPNLVPRYVRGEVPQSTRERQQATTWSKPPILPEHFIMSACPCGAGEGN
jgi:hypothetical protein